MPSTAVTRVKRPPTNVSPTPQSTAARLNARQLHHTSAAQSQLQRAIADPDAVIDWPPAITAALAPLTLKQRRWLLAVAAGVEPCEAVRMSYDISSSSPSGAPSAIAFQLLQQSNIASAKVLILSWLDRQWLLDSGQAVDYCMSKLYDLANHGKTESVRLGAVQTIMRKHGELVNRTRVEHVDVAPEDGQEAILGKFLGAVTEQLQSSQQIGESMQDYQCPRCASMRSVSEECFDGAGI